MKPPPQPPPDGHPVPEGAGQPKEEKTRGEDAGSKASEGDERASKQQGEEAPEKNKKTWGVSPERSLKKEMESQDSIVLETEQSDWDVKMSGDEEDDTWAAEEARAKLAAQASLERGTEEAGYPEGNGRTLPEEESDTKTSAAQEGQQPGADSALPEVHPSEMFEAVVQAIKADPGSTAREEWVTTVAELFTVAHREVSIKEDKIPAAKRKYPKLRGDEKTLLFRLFTEACVTDLEKYNLWSQRMEKITQELYNSTWSFCHILENHIGKIQWNRQHPLNQWSAKVKAGTQQDEARQTTQAAASGYQSFMFNPAVFKQPEQIRLREECEKADGDLTGKGLREASSVEWEIIEGIATGTIVCRRMPDFISSVMDAKEQMRLYKTIQSQVEGELTVQLRSGVSIKENRQQTREIREDILAAGVAEHVNVPELKIMLNMAKTISYDYVRRQIHIFFFDRGTARKYQDMMIPFKKGIYRVVNPHSPDSGSVWNRQKGRDGVRRSDQRVYVIDMYNVTRFTDVGRLAAYLTKHMQAEFDMEDLDTCTPNSRTSTVWRLTIKSAECPQFLRGVVRIIWYGRPLVLKHPYVRQRRQCLRCGNLGHTMAWCGYADAQLHGPGSQTANDQEVAELEDLAKPFESFDEIKRSAARRLQIRAQVERKASAAVTPKMKEAEAAPSHEEHTMETVMQEKPGDADSKDVATRVPPRPKPGWVAVSKAKGRKMYAHQDQLDQRGGKSATRYAECVNDSDGNPKSEAPEEPSRAAKEIINISSDDETEESKQPMIAPEDKALLHLVKKKPPKISSTPQLVALKQRERNTIAVAVLAVKETTGGRIPMEEMEEEH
jgi:hypothetical protein